MIEALALLVLGESLIVVFIGGAYVIILEIDELKRMLNERKKRGE